MRLALSGDVVEQQIEGIPASETNGLYGGSDQQITLGFLDMFQLDTVVPKLVKEMK